MSSKLQLLSPIKNEIENKNKNKKNNNINNNEKNNNQNSDAWCSSYQSIPYFAVLASIMFKELKNVHLSKSKKKKSMLYT